MTEPQQTDWPLVGVAAGAVALLGTAFVLAPRAASPTRRNAARGSYVIVGASENPKPAVRLSYLAPNQAFVFTFGDQILRLGNEPLFYAKRDDAVRTAMRYGMKVDAHGVVTVAYNSNPDRCPRSMQVQSLLMPRTDFTRAEALRWAREHGFKATKVDATDRYFRIRQKAPGQFSFLRTVQFGKGPIQAVIGCPLR